MRGSVWYHKKSGHLYTVMDFCRLEATNRPGVLYRRTDGSENTLWARDEDEFLDGRFVPAKVSAP